MRFSASPLLSLYSLNFLIWASATKRGCPKFFNSGFQVLLNLLRTGSLTQLLIVSLAFPTHWASKRVSLCESSDTQLPILSWKVMTNTRYKDECPPNFITSTLGRVGPCFIASCNGLPGCLVWLCLSPLSLWHLPNWLLREMLKCWQQYLLKLVIYWWREWLRCWRYILLKSKLFSFVPFCRQGLLSLDGDCLV